MNYRHLYHAGNFADIFKHLILIELLNALKRKATPFCVLDTHAGVGLYDLYSEAPQKTQEYLAGVAKFIDAKHPISSATILQAIIHHYNSDGKLRYYPGSPHIIKSQLRAHDRLIACELHAEDVIALKASFKMDKQVAVHCQNGFLAMKAFLPPKEKRGLVFIDPPYEQETEWQAIIDSITLAQKHFYAGCYAIWYPIKSNTKLHTIESQLKKATQHEILKVEFLCLPNDVANRLNGCGMLIINPPWQIDHEIKSILQYLKERLACHATQIGLI